MRRYLLDTGIAGLYVARRDPVHARVREESRRGNVVGICTPVLAELHYGAENSASRDRSLQKLRISLPSLRVWPLTDTAAEEYGRISAELRRIGRPMQQIDRLIAAIARTLGNCTVVSSDSDLLAIPGLAVENWSLA
ncbi:MAG: type II toxin-antitoxin system VapC family toxin [Gemmataceae bacterium]